jgi:hypothetical protein
VGSNAPDLYIPKARAQALAKLGGQVNIVSVRAASVGLPGTWMWACSVSPVAR